MVCFRKNLKRLFRNKYIVILKKGVLRTIHPGPSQN
jgi:hypothetical protein